MLSSSFAVCSLPSMLQSAMSPAPTKVTAEPGTGGVTVMAALPLFPSLVAVIVADPSATAVTRPVALTVAAVSSLLVQLTTRPDSGAPFASRGVAVSCTVAPLATVASAGSIVTAATGTTSAGVPALISMPSAAPLRLFQLASIVLRFVAHCACRSEGGLSADGASAISVNPTPGVTAATLLATPKTPSATLAELPNAASATLSPFPASARLDPVCPMAPAPFAPLPSTPCHCDTTHCTFDTFPTNVMVMGPLPGDALIAR